MSQYDRLREDERIVVMLHYYLPANRFKHMTRLKDNGPFLLLQIETSLVIRKYTTTEWSGLATLSDFVYVPFTHATFRILEFDKLQLNV